MQKRQMASHYIVSTEFGVAAVEKLRPFLRAYFVGITDVDMNKIAQGVRAVVDPEKEPFQHQGLTIIRRVDPDLYEKVARGLKQPDATHPLSDDAMFFARFQGRPCIH